MSKWYVVLIGVAIIVGTWWFVRENARYTPDWDKPKYGEVSRGEIRVPVTATGLIEPHQRIEIKPEASGEVIDIKVREGDYVKAGDVILVIKQDDEKRNVARAQAQLDRATAQLAQSRVNAKTRRSEVDTSAARLEEIAANLERAEFDYKRSSELDKRGTTGEREMVVAKNTFEVTKAQKKQAEAAVAQANFQVSNADEQIKIAEATVQEATNTLEDAKQRLRDTTIYARGDSLVAEVRVKKGNLVQSGIGTVTGGSVLVVLADVSRLKVLTRVDESDYGRITNIAPIDSLPQMPGKREAIAAQEASQLQARTGNVKISVDAFPDRDFEGRIELVEPQGKLNSGASVIQFDVHVEVTDKDKFFLPLGSQAQVEFTVESVKDAILVPAEAVKTREGEKGVWVSATPLPGAQWGKKFIRCRFGITDGVNTQVAEILDGEKLEPKTQVYTKLPTDREEKN